MALDSVFTVVDAAMNHMRLSKSIFFFMLAPSVCLAVTIPLGVVSFDNLIPAGATPGVNIIDIYNFTGDPSAGGFALPPDFPVITAVTFQSVQIEVSSGAAIALPDITSGPLPQNAALEFPTSASLSEVTLFFTLSQTSLLLSNGNTFVAESDVIQTQLLPSSGNHLLAGTDFALIVASNVAVSSVPEPRSAALFLITAVGASLLLMRRRAFFAKNGRA